MYYCYLVWEHVTYHFQNVLYEEWGSSVICSWSPQGPCCVPGEVEIDCIVSCSNRKIVPRQLPGSVFDNSNIDRVFDWSKINFTRSRPLLYQDRMFFRWLLRTMFQRTKVHFEFFWNCTAQMFIFRSRRILTKCVNVFADTKQMWNTLKS